jgi:hypothetical protein
MVEQDDAVVILEGWRHEAPHVLIAAEPMSEDRRPALRVAADLDVVAAQYVHAPGF